MRWLCRQAPGKDVLGTLWLIGGRLHAMAYASPVSMRGLHHAAVSGGGIIARVGGFMLRHWHVTALGKEDTFNVVVITLRCGEGISRPPEGWIWSMR
jgi:hypothetical protein